MEQCSYFLFLLYLIFSTTYALSSQFFANAYYFWLQILRFEAIIFYNYLIIRPIFFVKNSQMICDNSHQRGFCENRPRFYWVLRPQKYSFFANDASFLLFFFICEKITAFCFIAFSSNPSKSGFSKNLNFRKWFFL